MKGIGVKGVKWAKRALAVKLGKTAVKKGGLVGVGIGAAAGLGYLVWSFSKKCKNSHSYDRPINKITTDSEKKIVV
ncbi:hypothetical protein [Salegentibacter sp. F14]